MPESVVGPGAAIDTPPASVSTAIDDQAELAVNIGKGGKDGKVGKFGKDGKDGKGGKGGKGGKAIAAKGAVAHVWGCTIVNDITTRDWQSRHQQWHMGKSFDTFCPMARTWSVPMNWAAPTLWCAAQ